MSTTRTFVTNFKSVLSELYPADGVDIVDKTFNGMPDPDGKEPGSDLPIQEYTAYKQHWLTLLTSFLGLPNRDITHTGQSAANIFFNFIGWQPVASRATTVINGILIPVVAALNLLRVALMLPLNILKLGTELLTALVAGGLGVVFTKLQNKSNQSNGVINFLAGIAIIPVFLLFLPAIALSLIGRAITSPVVSVRAAFKLGNETMGKVGGIVFASLSIVTTALAYATLFPLAAHLLAATTIMPVVMSHLPASLSYALNAAIRTIGPITATIGKTLGMITYPMTAGLGAIVGAAVATVGAGVNKLVKSVRNWWHTLSAIVDEPQLEAPASAAAELKSSTSNLLRKSGSQSSLSSSLSSNPSPQRTPSPERAGTPEAPKTVAASATVGTVSPVPAPVKPASGGSAPAAAVTPVAPAPAGPAPAVAITPVAPIPTASSSPHALLSLTPASSPQLSNKKDDASTPASGTAPGLRSSR